MSRQIGNLPSPDLVQACLSGDCVLYAGAGLGARAGYPTWTPLVGDLLKWVIGRDLVEQDFQVSLEGALHAGETDLVADSIVSACEERGAAHKLNRYLEEAFSPDFGSPTDAHRILAGLNFSGVMTTSFDELVERAVEEQLGEPPPVYVPEDSDELLTALSQRTFFVLKLYGSFRRPPVLLAPAQFQEAVAGNLPFADFVRRLFVTRTILFIGASLEGIGGYLRVVNFRRSETRRHYALVAVQGEGWQIQADLLKRRYGIEVLPYAPLTPDHRPMLDFLRELEKQVQARVESPQRQPGPARETELAALTHVSLRNIGPFAELEVDLDRQLTVLLGDNGVGKSTILKAIGFAVSGDDDPETARRLIKRDETNGKIALTTVGGKKYETEIHLRSDDSAPIVERYSGSWLAIEQKLAMGFPPFRAVGRESPRGPRVDSVGRAVPRDVLPIATGGHDQRIGEMKQWLIDVDYRIGGGWSRGSELLEVFFAVLEDVAKPVKVEFPKERNWSEGGPIEVITDDGLVPLDYLSQGTQSLMGWIGVLLQRLFEVYEGTPNPSEGFALVLMDEIDAHMHPAWQQSLIPRVRRHFPKIQLIATSHSPFVVTGRQAEEVVRLRRDPKSRAITTEPVEVDLKGMSVASVLTSYLFGLESQVDPETEAMILERRELAMKNKLSEDERQRLSELDRRLAPYSASTENDPLYRRYLEALAQLDLEEEEEASLLAPRSAADERRQREVTLAILRKLREEDRREGDRPA